MHSLPSLRSLVVLEAVARLGSFAKAAGELKVSPSAVSHQMSALETELGMRLFHRAGRSVMFTEAGIGYAAEISTAFQAIEDATRNLTRQSKMDILTIHSVVSLASQWLMPRLCRFSAEHPGIDVRLNASSEPAELRTGTVDVDIRYGPQIPETGVVAEPFPPEPIVVLCSPALMAERPIRRPADVANHALIHSEINLYRWSDWASDHGVDLNVGRGLRFDRSFMAINAAIEGLGICLESRLLVTQELASGRLVAPFGCDTIAVNCHSIAYLRSRGRTPKILAFRKWMADLLEAERVGLPRAP